MHEAVWNGAQVSTIFKSTTIKSQHDTYGPCYPSTYRYLNNKNMFQHDVSLTIKYKTYFVRKTNEQIWKWIIKTLRNVVTKTWYAMQIYNSFGYNICRARRPNLGQLFQRGKLCLHLMLRFCITALIYKLKVWSEGICVWLYAYNHIVWFAY